LHVSTEEKKNNDIYGVLSLCKTAVSRVRRGLISEDSSDRKFDNVERSLMEFDLMLFFVAMISSGLETTDEYDCLG